VGIDEELAARAAAARDVAVFRYGLIRAAADPGLPPWQRGALVRALAAGQHKDPGGQLVRVGRSTLDRWIRDWRAGGFDALVPGTRNVQPRTSAGVLELAVALKKEKPERTAAQVHRILAARLGGGQVPSVRTIQRHFVRMELTGLSGAAAPPEVFGRFEAAAPGELWVSDVLHGPPAGPAPKTYLFGIEDDMKEEIHKGAREAVESCNDKIFVGFISENEAADEVKAPAEEEPSDTHRGGTDGP